MYPLLRQQLLCGVSDERGHRVGVSETARRVQRARLRHPRRRRSLRAGGKEIDVGLFVTVY